MSYTPARTTGGHFTVEGFANRRGRRGLGEAYKEARLDASTHIVSYWWGRYLKRHFEPSAVMRYGYKKRTAKHQRRKSWMHGHQRPLEWSGTFRRLMEGVLPPTKIVAGEIRATWAGMPRYIYYVSSIAAGHKPDMRAEVTTVSGDEESVLAYQFERRMARLLGESIAA